MVPSMRAMVDVITELDPAAAAELLRFLGGTRTETAWRAAESRVRVKAERYAARHLGMTLTIRTAAARVGGSGRTFTGTIVAATVAGLRRRERSVVARFAVTIEGPTGVRETHTVEGFRADAAKRAAKRQGVK